MDQIVIRHATWPDLPAIVALLHDDGRRGCGMVQLTADKTRRDAHRFYESLGFVARHEGMKLEL
jgi:hypothetical protein